MKILDLIFYRLLFLYRKEKEGAIDSASNYLTAIILVSVGAFVGTLVNIFFRPPGGWGLNYSRSALFFIVVPIFFVLSYFIKQHYKKNIGNVDFVKMGERLKFNLFTLWLMIVFLALITVYLPRLING